MVQELFYENPGKEFYLRQIARLTKTPKTTVARRLNQLTKSGVIKRVNAEPFPLYVSNSEKKVYTYRKKIYILQKIFESNIVEYIIDQTHPSTIVLYGSMASGNYDKNSDIDIFIESEETELDFSRFERKLKHKIHPWFELYLDDVGQNLKLSIINGVKLHGYIKINVEGVPKKPKKSRYKPRKNKITNRNEQATSKSNKTIRNK